MTSRDLRRIGDPEPDTTAVHSDDDSDDGYHGSGGVADALDEISRKFANVSLDHTLGSRGDTVDRSQVRFGRMGCVNPRLCEVGRTP